jgi:hypothetical protein
MLLTFKSKGAGDIQMFSENAEQLLTLIGKSLEPANAPRGIITKEQVPEALAKLKAAADAARSAAREREDGAASNAPVKVGLAQRAFPLIELLERAARNNADVVWGV